MGVSNPKKADLSKITHKKATSKKIKNTPKVSSKKSTEIIIDVSDAKASFKGVMSPFKRANRTYLEQANSVKYIIAKKGDTFYKIAEEFQLTLSQLHRYNDFPKGKDFLVEGDIVYIQPKRSAAKSLKEVTLQKELSVIEISQAYGVKTSEIVKRNNLASSEVVLSKGKKVKL